MEQVTEKTIYQALLEEECEISNHESDLYTPVDPVSIAILKDYPVHRSNATTFICQITGRMMYDIPFAYDPFWKNKDERCIHDSTRL